MLTRFLLDTHVVVRWLVEPRKLSREQTRVIEEALRRREPVSLCAMSLLEIAALTSAGRLQLGISLHEIFGRLQADPLFSLLPLTYDVASEFASLGENLRDPADRAIVATARVHGLRLITSDLRIIESKLVAVVE